MSTPLRRALMQLLASGSPIGPDALSELALIVAAAIDWNMHVANSGKLDALQMYEHGKEMHGLLELRSFIDAVNS